MKQKLRNVLIELRKITNLNQKDIAKALEISTSYYGMIETGVRTPNLYLAHKIANFFDKSIEEIFFND